MEIQLNSKDKKKQGSVATTVSDVDSVISSVRNSQTTETLSVILSSFIEEDTHEPSIYSNDPNERKIARRIRIQKRLDAAKKRLEVAIGRPPDDEEEEEVDDDEVLQQVIQKKTPVELQVFNSNLNVCNAIDSGVETVTNVEVAVNAYEVKRRETEKEIRDARIKYLEGEADIARKKFDTINEKWEKIAVYNDPLDLYEETEAQKEKCKELLDLKDAVIKRLQDELKASDIRFLKDQEKQSADMNLLVERINEQIKIMKRILRKEITAIEEAIEKECTELTNIFNKRWDELDHLRESDQLEYLKTKFQAIEEHFNELHRIMVEHHEKFRASKMHIANDCQGLVREVEQIKAICLTNKEKIAYNYQLLKKKDEENLIIKSQQKRRINKLQDIATSLRRQVKEMTMRSELEIKKLKAEVVNLHDKIENILLKSKNFRTANKVKFKEVWYYNKEKTNDLMKKIMEIDQVIYEQILGLDWVEPEEYTKLTQNFKMTDDALEKAESESMTTSESETNKGEFEEKQEKDMQRNKLKLVRHLLSVVADSTGFLIEDRLHELLKPYDSEHATIVYLHNIFAALGLTHHQDIEMLLDALEPYINCETCVMKATAEVKEQMAPLQSEIELEDDTKPKKGEILTQISDMVSQQKTMIQTVVTEMTGYRDRRSDFLLSEIHDDASLSISESMSGSVDFSTETVTVMVDKTNVLDMLDGDEPGSQVRGTNSTIETKDENEANRHLHHIHLAKDTRKEELAQKEEKFHAASIVKHVKCRNPLHNLVIEPIYVLKALQHFVSDINKDESHDIPLTLAERLAIEKTRVPYSLSKPEIMVYWDAFKNFFSSKQEKLWDALLLGLHKYYTLLQERHVLNTEIEQLKTQNNDLKRLLQHYTIRPIENEDNDRSNVVQF